MGSWIRPSLPGIFGILVLNFLLSDLAPGDAASGLAGESGAATPEYMDALRHKFGLDQSLGMQFVTYVSNMAHFNLGYSYRNDADVSSLILERLGPTSLLMLTAFGTAVALGIVLGLVAATGRNSWRDNIISLISLVAYATPGFWLGLMMIVIFSIGLGWLPTSGFGPFVAGQASVRPGADRHGLRHDGARQGPDRASHHDGSRPTQCAVAYRDDRRRSGRQSDRRLHRRGNRLRLATPRHPCPPSAPNPGPQFAL